MPIEIPDRHAAIERARQSGRKIAAVLPIHHPRALLEAFGFLPVEVWGPPGRDLTSGDAHLQVYTCSIVRSSLAFLLDGGLDSCDLLVVPHGCDSLQGLGSLLIDLLPHRLPVVPFYLPRGEAASAVDFLAAELREMAQRIAATGAKMPNDDALMAAIEANEDADERLERLWTARASLPFDNRTFYRVVRSREYLAAADFSLVADAALAALAAKDDLPAGVPVLLSGVVPEPMALLDTLTSAGALVVADDTLCCGRRIYPRGHSPQPWRRLAERLLAGPADSTRGSTIDSRADHLTALAERSGARVVLFHLVKFCEPELFYLPRLRAALEQRGLRHLTLEVDLSEGMAHQAVTRVEALLETVS